MDSQTDVIRASSQFQFAKSAIKILSYDTDYSMNETTHTHCALNDCTHDAVEQLIAPPTWETYLLEEHDYSEFEHLEIPLCIDHYITYNSLRDLSYRRPSDLTDEKRTEVNQQVESFLDSLDLGLLIDKPQRNPANSLSSAKIDNN